MCDNEHQQEALSVGLSVDDPHVEYIGLLGPVFFYSSFSFCPLFFFHAANLFGEKYSVLPHFCINAGPMIQLLTFFIGQIFTGHWTLVMNLYCHNLRLKEPLDKQFS